MGPDSRLRTGSIILTVLVVCILLVSSIGHTATPQQASTRGPEDVKIVTVDPDSQDKLWPYTSRERRFETLTLPINVVVLGNDTRIRWFLMTGRNVNWNESEGEWRGVGGEAVGEMTGRQDWYESHGATRYTYIQSPKDPYGGWVDESYQLHDGDYFGTRYHIRAYTGGQLNTSWTAIQAHHEHWDWFRLRHTVGSTADARRYVEQQFYGTEAVKRVGRERYANGGLSDADGWVTVAVMKKPTPPTPGDAGTGTGLGPGTVVRTGPGLATGTAPAPANGTGTGPTNGTATGTTTTNGMATTTGSVARSVRSAPSAPSPIAWGLSVALLTGAVLSVGVADVRHRLTEVELGSSERLVVLAAVSLLTMPSLRWVSITVERTLPWLSPKVIAGLGYLVIALWLPLAVVLLSRGTQADRAAPLAAIGLGAGILLDYALVGITLIPVSVMLHRLAVVLTIGLLAVAGTRLRTDRPGHVALPVVATLCWIGVLLWPFVDLL